MTVTISPVYTGTTSNDGTGDTIQTAFNKVNASLFNLAGNLNPLITPGLVTTYANSAYGVFANLSVTNAVLGAVNFTTTPTVNGSPVSTSAQSFTGGYVPTVAIFGANLIANSATASGNVSTGAVVVIGGVGISGNINVGGNSAIGGNLTVTSGTDSSGYNSGSLTTAGGLGVQKNAWFGQGLYVTGAGSFGGTLTVTGATTISSSAVSSGTNTGALIVAGGVGVGGALNVGGNVTVTNLTVSGNLVANTSGVITSAVLDLNTPVSLAPLTQQTTGNIGTVFHYYDSAGAGDSHAFAGRMITGIGTLSNAFAYYSSVNYSDSGGGSPVGTQLGTIAGGSLIAANATPSTSTTTGALLVSGGAGIAGNVFAGNVSTTNVSGTLQTASQPNITQVGNLTSLSVAGVTTLYGNIIPAVTANASINIGGPSNWFATIYGTSTHAQYADLAENYLTDQIYEPGTVVVVGGDAEVTACTDHGQDNVIGAISTNPAYLMNGSAGGQPIALKGRIPLKVYGPIQKGQRLSTSHEIGHAEYSRGDYSFAIALETDISMGSKIIEAIIL